MSWCPDVTTLEREREGRLRWPNTAAYETTEQFILLALRGWLKAHHVWRALDDVETDLKGIFVFFVLAVFRECIIKMLMSQHQASSSHRLLCTFMLNSYTSEGVCTPFIECETLKAQRFRNTHNSYLRQSPNTPDNTQSHQESSCRSITLVYENLLIADYVFVYSSHRCYPIWYALILTSISPTL